MFPILGFANEEAAPLGTIVLPLTLFDRAAGRSYTQKVNFVVMAELNTAVIIGKDAISLFYSGIDLAGHKVIFHSTLTPDGSAAPELNPKKQALLFVYKAAVVPAGCTVYVQVYFDRRLQDNKDTPILCEPTPVINRRGHAVALRFPPHLTDSSYSFGPGRYRLAIHNTSFEPLTLHRATRIGLATAVLEPVISTLDQMYRVDAATGKSAIDRLSSSDGSHCDTVLSSLERLAEAAFNESPDSDSTSEL